MCPLLCRPQPDADDDNPAKRQRGDDATPADAGEHAAPRALKFRNYKPLREELGIATEPAAPVRLQVTAAPDAAGQTTAALVDASELAGLEVASLAGDDLAKLAPKPITWDLERDLESRREKLAGRTQRALIEMLREKLAHAPEGITVVLEQPDAEARA